MDNMKARAWMEGEMPHLHFDDPAREWLEHIIVRATTGASTVANLTERAVKSARLGNAKDTKGDFGFVTERFFRDSEADFYKTLDESANVTKEQGNEENLTIAVLEGWARAMGKTALRVFDEYVPFEGIQRQNMEHHVRTRVSLAVALRGNGTNGKTLFDDDLGIPSPRTKRARETEKEKKTK